MSQTKMAQVGREAFEQTTVSQLPFSELELSKLAEEFGTPLYIIDERTLRTKVHKLKQGYSGYKGPVKIAYSIKTNFTPAVLKTFMSENTLFDLTSTGELYFYLRCGGKPENVIYTSVTETWEEFSEVLRSGIRLIVVGSSNGLSNLMGIAEKEGYNPKIMIRVDPEVGVKAEVRASRRNGRFGVPLSNNAGSLDCAAGLLRRIMASHLEFEGFHFHLGSQISDPACFLNALEKLEHFIAKMRREFPHLPVNIVDIGGGTPVNYGIRVPTPLEIGSMLEPRLNALAATLGSEFTLIVESGRYLSAEACVLLSRVLNTKNFGDQKVVFIDAGYHLLLDAVLLRQEYPQLIIPSCENEINEKIVLAGRLCDTYDTYPLSPASKVSGAEIGKLMAITHAGAYSIVFNMPFHCQTKPAIVMRKANGSYKCVRQHQTNEQLFEEEGGNLV
ncbi:MAG: hypothetical protein HY619_06915 [Thaumarchaeota archaeon]|nr:hypothetical protein [Nitrososphaerota archaeon]